MANGNGTQARGNALGAELYNAKTSVLGTQLNSVIGQVIRDEKDCETPLEKAAYHAVKLLSIAVANDVLRQDDGAVQTFAFARQLVPAVAQALNGNGAQAPSMGDSAGPEAEAPRF